VGCCTTRRGWRRRRSDSNIYQLDRCFHQNGQPCKTPAHGLLLTASIQIESLPMNGVDGQSLQNVLSISTAANNRYLLHFNSLHSLTQWTAGIRLAIFEYATLQEAYTGSIIAGKGKYLNNIRTIMERSRYPSGDWARVRFGAGTPWRRCWCVITPPGEKEMHKAVKREKKRSAYDQSVLPVTGDIKFYENRKITKKSKPIATITNAFSAYAIYPQSKPLIDQSTLVKVEGFITIHSTPESTTEGFVFVMPEVHPAVTGFEMMLRWMLPVFDTFGLYGRPSRLIADVLDTRSLMFAMPTQRRYGYLELIDVAGLIHTEGSQKWNEREWRKQMKALTSKRMTTASLSPKEVGGSMGSRRGEGRSSLNLPASLSRSSLNLPARNGIKFTDDNLVKSSPSSRRGSPAPTGENGAVTPPRRVDSAPPDAGSFVQSRQHHRSVSDAHGYKRQVEPSPLLFEQHASEEQPPLSSQYVIMPDTNGMGDYRTTQEQYSDPNADHWSEQSGSTSEREYGSQINGDVLPRVEALGADDRTLNPVEAPPIMAHGSGEKPRTLPNQMPDLRRANLAIDDATLAQLADANRESNANHGLVNPQLFGNTNANMMINSKYQPSLNHMTNGYYPSPNQPMSSAYQPPPNSTMYSYQPQPNMYQSSPNSYQPPTNYSMIQVPRQRGGPSQDRRLPTIPGTPAFEPNQFDLPVMERTVQEPMQRPDQPIMHRTTSSGSISRRTVPSQIIQGRYMG